ncbi:helix-turn-helix transcriptional regulator [Lentzea flaviverrucosa]|uniref:Helix-turn-helix domain-containing protein n=1 Tax=Lentzea flaviverrucosa TaxID=200379 RepID=A0A1H9EYM5_9PSEU|nr:helix-turn-helix transcriptional regulator [Lentzea flaviverrucosa]RDI35374.1 helix-turn-helix protein [Lentzea flaviverrucosa]SEQ30088.1 Helix-turn-helix domain-containing protein [Lentzea flaviverrucosa]
MARSAAVQRLLNELGDLLREHRKGAKISGVEAARRAGFSQSKLSKIETGQLWASLTDVRRLARGLRMDQDVTAQAIELMRRLQEAVAPTGSPKVPVPLAQRDPGAQRDLDELGEIIREHRNNAKISGAEVERRARVSQWKLSKIENGRLLPTSADVRRLASELGMGAGATRRALELMRRLEEARRRRRAEERSSRHAQWRRPQT